MCRLIPARTTTDIHMQTFLHSPCMCQCFQGLCIALRLSLSLHLEEAEGCYVKFLIFSLHKLSLMLAQPPFSKNLHHTPLLIIVSSQFLSPVCWPSVNSFISVHNPPAQSAHPDTSSLHQFAGASESMQHCLSLFTVDFTNDSQQQLFSPSSESFSVLFCERSCVKSCLPSSITSIISNSPTRFLPVAMDDLKTAWLKNKKTKQNWGLCPCCTSVRS